MVQLRRVSYPVCIIDIEMVRKREVRSPSGLIKRTPLSLNFQLKVWKRTQIAKSLKPPLKLNSVFLT
jgi:hypothetical protein